MIKNSIILRDENGRLHTSTYVSVVDSKKKAETNEIGQKHDQGKARMDLIPFGPLEEIANVLTFGASKYSDNNWKHVENPVARYEAALLRHISAYKKGEMNDPETGLPHLAHAGCCLMFLMEFTTGSLSSHTSK